MKKALKNILRNLDGITYDELSAAEKNILEIAGEALGLCFVDMTNEHGEVAIDWSEMK